MSQILTISNDLRTIDIPRDFVLGVESDDDVNRVYFSLPAMYGDTALWPYKIRINYMNANGEGDMYTVPDEDKEIEANGVVDSIAIADAVEEVIEFTDARYASSYDQDTVHLYYHEPDELDAQSNSVWFDVSSDTICMYRTAYGDQQWHDIEEKYVYDTTTGEWTGYPAVEASRLKTILRLLANNWSSNENSTISYSEDMFLFVAKTEAAANSFLAQTGSAPYFLFAEYSKNNTLVTKLYQYVPKADGTAREWIEITDESTFGVPKNESGVPIYGDNYHIRFSWLVGRHACEIKGKVRFIVCLKLTDDQGVITNEFNTAVHEVPVLEGLETSEAIVQEREDIIEAILLRMDKIESIDIEGGYDKVIEVLDSIPEDYSELSQDVSDLKDDLSQVQDVLEIPLDLTVSGDAPASLQAITIATGLRLISGHSYTYTVSLVTASEQPVYVHVRDANLASLNSISLNAGELTKSKTFTASSDVDDAMLTISDVNRAVSYTVSIKDADTSNALDDLGGVLGKLDAFVAKPSLLTFTVNTYIVTPDAGTKNVSINQVALNGCASLVVPCDEGDIFTLSGTPRNNSGSRPYMWLASSGTCLYRSNGTGTLDNVEITAPADGMLVVNFATTAPYSVYKGVSKIHDHLYEDTLDIATMRSEYDAELGLYLPRKAVGVTVADNAVNAIMPGLTLESGVTYTFNFSIRYPSDNPIYIYLKDPSGNNLRTATLNAGDVEVSKSYTATSDFDGAYIAVHSGSRAVRYTITFEGDSEEKRSKITQLIYSPLETMPEYMINNMAYRPLGELQRPYLCLVCDDGTSGLASYTIPMLLEKEVPCTFALWSTASRSGDPWYTPNPSIILQTQEGIDLVKQAVTDIGCSVAQHGYVEWTEMTEADLNMFFDREAEAFTDIGIEVSGAVCPAHSVNNRVRAIVGGRFGSVRSGYNGFKNRADRESQIAGDVFTPYGLLTGARSNCYSYTAFNIIDSDKPVETLKSMLDTAISNNYIMITYWHDWNFIDSDENYLANRAKLEAFIDYAKTTSVTFCTLSEIPTLY